MNKLANTLDDLAIITHHSVPWNPENSIAAAAQELIANQIMRSPDICKMRLAVNFNNQS